MADRYAVFGNPVRHSLSPRIHRAFAEQLGQDIEYDAVQVEVGEFAAAARRFLDGGGCGLNVTVPFKLDAFRLAEVHSEEARLAGAVNTLSVGKDGRLHGDTTDGVGLVRDMVGNLGWPVEGQRVLVLGAGGAVRGVLGPLLEQGPAEVLVVNRTADKAVELAAAFSGLGAVRGGGYGLLHRRLAEGPCDLMISGTSAGLTGGGFDLPHSDIFRIAAATTWFTERSPPHSCAGRPSGRPGRLPTGWACWWSRRRNPFTSGAASGPTPPRFWPPFAPIRAPGRRPVDMPRRFIAGAVCPRCGEMDKLAVDTDADTRECVSCGYSDSRPVDAAAEPPTRVSRPAARRVETPAEPVRLLDPERDKGAG